MDKRASEVDGTLSAQQIKTRVVSQVHNGMRKRVAIDCLRLIVFIFSAINIAKLCPVPLLFWGIHLIAKLMPPFKYTFVFIQIMHLSMLSSKGGGGGEGKVCPEGGDFDHTRYSQGGEFDMATILGNEEGFESTLFPGLFPPQAVKEKPWKRGCLKITPPS